MLPEGLRNKDILLKLVSRWRKKKLGFFVKYLISVFAGNPCSEGCNVILESV